MSAGSTTNTWGSSRNSGADAQPIPAMAAAAAEAPGNRAVAGRMKV
jgi:hypothetical protein